MATQRIGALRHGKKRRDADKQAQANRWRQRLLAQARAIWAVNAREVGDPALVMAAEINWRRDGARVSDLAELARDEIEKATWMRTSTRVVRDPYNCTITPPAEQEARNSRLTNAVNWIRGLATPQDGR